MPDRKSSVRPLKEDIVVFQEDAARFLASTQRNEDTRRQLMETGDDLAMTAHRRGNVSALCKLKLQNDMLRCDQWWVIPEAKKGLHSFFPGFLRVPILCGGLLLGVFVLVGLCTLTFPFLLVLIVPTFWLAIKPMDPQPVEQSPFLERQAHTSLLNPWQAEGTFDGSYSGRPAWIRFYSSLMSPSGLLAEKVPDSARFRVSLMLSTASPVDIRLFKKCATNEPGSPLFVWRPVHLPEQYNLRGVKIQSDDPGLVTAWVGKNRVPMMAVAALFSQLLVDSLEIRGRYIVVKSYNETARLASKKENTILVLDSLSLVADALESAKDTGPQYGLQS